MSRSGIENLKAKFGQVKAPTLNVNAGSEATALGIATRNSENINLILDILNKIPVPDSDAVCKELSKALTIVRLQYEICLLTKSSEECHQVFDMAKEVLQIAGDDGLLLCPDYHIPVTS